MISINFLCLSLFSCTSYGAPVTRQYIILVCYRFFLVSFTNCVALGIPSPYMCFIMLFPIHTCVSLCWVSVTVCVTVFLFLHKMCSAVSRQQVVVIILCIPCNFLVCFSFWFSFMCVCVCVCVCVCARLQLLWAFFQASELEREQAAAQATWRLSHGWHGADWAGLLVAGK